MLSVVRLMCSSLIGLFIESIATKRYSQKETEKRLGGKLAFEDLGILSEAGGIASADFIEDDSFELRRNRYGGRRCRKIGLPCLAIIFGKRDIIAGSIINGVPFEGIGDSVKAEIGGCPANADGAG